jgi:KDO2-lipid IV(A) lauroyltransferase
LNLQRLLPWGSVPAALLPRAGAEALADLAGDLSWRLARGARATLAENLRLVAGAGAAGAHGGFRTYARYYLGMMRLAHRSVRGALGAWRWENVAALDASQARGRGILVLSAHFGNWDLIGMALAERYGDVCVFVERLHPPALYSFYRHVRWRHGVAVAPVGAPGRLPVEVLQRNGVVGLVADRPFGQRHATASCGAARLAVPAGGIRLALRAGAAVHAVFAVRHRGEWVLQVGPDLAGWGEAPAALEGRVQEVADGFALQLGAAVRRHPDQWCLLHPLGDGQPAEERGAA